MAEEEAMNTIRRVPPVHDSIAANLTQADDRLLLSNWLPPQAGIVPRIRFGLRWVNVLWALPVVFVLLVAGVAVAQGCGCCPACRRSWCATPACPPPPTPSPRASRHGCGSTTSSTCCS